MRAGKLLGKNIGFCSFICFHFSMYELFHIKRLRKKKTSLYIIVVSKLLF